MSTFLWILLGLAYLAALVWLGVATLRRGHWILFVLGIFLPLFWIIGALIAPAPGSADSV